MTDINFTKELIRRLTATQGKGVEHEGCDKDAISFTSGAFITNL